MICYIILLPLVKLKPNLACQKPHLLFQLYLKLTSHLISMYVCSADLCQCTKVPLKIHSVDTGTPLAIDSLLDSGATGLFIDVEFVKEQKLRTCPLPHPIPVYNIDGTTNEAGSITVGNKIVWMFGSFGLCIKYIF